MAPSATSVIETTPTYTSFDTLYEKPLFLDNHGVNTPKGIIGNALKNRVENIDHEQCEPGDEEAFFVADLGEVYRQHMRWKKNLPRVKPFYGQLSESHQQAVLTAKSGQVQPRQ